MISFLRRWKREHRERLQYAVPRREPFFDIAKKYLPQHPDAIVLDIGPGNSAFVDYAQLKERFPNSYHLLEGNKDSVASLEKSGYRVAYYSAPEQLPFPDASVAFVHLSHIVEHLYHEDLYVFLKELDRVMSAGGIIVISTPLLWERFYDDMSHVKPYNPTVFMNYLTKCRENASRASISQSYIVRELVYRYRVIDANMWGSTYFIVDVLMRMFRVVVSLTGFRKYVKNGYTLVLEKQYMNNNKA